MREKELLYLTDEDFELIGVDPKSISDELFDLVVEELKEYYNDGFSDVLKDCHISATQIQNSQSKLN